MSFPFFSLEPHMSSALPGCSKRQTLVCQSPWDVPCSLLGNRFLGEKHNLSITFHAEQLSLNTMQQPLHLFLPIEQLKKSPSLSLIFRIHVFSFFLFGTSHEQCPTGMFEKADPGVPKSLGCTLLFAWKQVSWRETQFEHHFPRRTIES